MAGGKASREFGLTAEEGAEVYPELVGRDSAGQISTVKYHELIPMLLNELQKQHRQFQTHRDRLARLETRQAEGRKTPASGR